MTNEHTDQLDISFKWFLSFSAGLHLALFLFFTVKTVFFPSEDLLIKSAMRVDMVALPDKYEQPKPEVKPTPKPEVVTKPIEKPKPKPKVKKPIEKIKPKVNVKEKQNDALTRLKALEAIQSEVKKPAEVKPVEYKGNIIRKGSDLKGLDKLQFDGYFSTLKSHIKEQWVVPQWLAESDLKTQVLVKIDSQGFVTNKQITISSGNTIFDDKALEAIDRASPCPIPPDKLKGLIAEEGILFNFP